MRVLLVDDSQFIREYLRKLLEPQGWTCAEAPDGEQALQRLRGVACEGEGFDLMLVDVNMPVMDGLHCVKQLRDAGLGPQMKVMMVTTEADMSYIRTALEVGADEFLMKPFTPQSLGEKIALLGLGRAA